MSQCTRDEFSEDGGFCLNLGEINKPGLGVPRVESSSFRGGKLIFGKPNLWSLGARNNGINPLRDIEEVEEEFTCSLKSFNFACFALFGVELEMRLTERTLSVTSGVLQVDKEYDGLPFLRVLFIGVKEEPGEEIRVRPRMLFCICEDIGDSGGGSLEGFIMVGSNSFISLL